MSGSEAPTYGMLQLCRNRAGYEAVPESKLALDLDAVNHRLTQAGFEPLVNAGVITVVRWGIVEVSVFESGKLLFKTKSEDHAADAMRAFREAMGWA